MDNHTNRRHIRRGSAGRGIVPINSSFFVFVFVSVAFCALPACSPRVVEKVHTEYVTQTVHHRDTTIRRDSIYIREWLKGDTVYVEKFRDRYVYRDRWRDSVQVKEVHDTTSVEVKIEKSLSWSQKAKIGAFWWLLAVALGLAGWTFRKPLLSIIKKWLP